MQLVFLFRPTNVNHSAARVTEKLNFWKRAHIGCYCRNGTARLHPIQTGGTHPLTANDHEKSGARGGFLSQRIQPHGSGEILLCNHIHQQVTGIGCLYFAQSWRRINPVTELPKGKCLEGV